ncbi:MAG: Biopolymer transport protein ExbB, partial [Pseudomonadota bacterium]
MSLLTFWLEGDLVIRFVALALLALSVSTWVIIAWKWAVLRRVQHDVPQSIAAFWQASQFDDALQRVTQFDRDQSVKPMLEATVLPLGGT